MRSGPIGDMHRFAMTEQLKSKTSCISMISVCLTNTPQIAHMVSVRTGESGEVNIGSFSVNTIIFNSSVIKQAF